MKFLVLCLTVCTALAFAEGASQLGAIHPSGSGSVSTEFIVFSQAYTFAALQNGYRYYNTTSEQGYMCDDFKLAANADIQKILIWMIYQGALPTDYDLAIARDAGDSDPNNATIVWSETVPVTHVDTGDDSWGYDIWETTCQTYWIDAYPSLIAGFQYWFIFSFHGDEYWLVQAPVFGSYPWAGETLTTLANCFGIFGETSDAFFELYAMELALERETWGSIKSVF